MPWLSFCIAPISLPFIVSILWIALFHYSMVESTRLGLFMALALYWEFWLSLNTSTILVLVIRLIVVLLYWLQGCPSLIEFCDCAPHDLKQKALLPRLGLLPIRMKTPLTILTLSPCSTGYHSDNPSFSSFTNAGNTISLKNGTELLITRLKTMIIRIPILQ